MKKISFIALLCAVFVTTSAFAESQPEESNAPAATEIALPVATPNFTGPDYTMSDPNGPNYYCYFEIPESNQTDEYYTQYIWELNGSVYSDAKETKLLIEHPYFSTFGVNANGSTATLRCKTLANGGRESEWTTMKVISIIP